MTPSPERATETILLVDDNDENLRMVQRILELRGFEVLAACSGEDAVRIQDNFPRTIHLLLSDVSMPGMSGPDLAKILKNLRPDLRVMLMSGYAEGMIVLNYGWYFIKKPFLGAALMGRIQDVLHSERRDQGTDHFDTRL